MFGYRSYPEHGTSTNCSWLALPTFGESWHNNHHAFPASARAGFAPWEIDLSWYVILGLERLGLAWDVKQPTPEERSLAKPPQSLGEWMGVCRPS